MGVIGWRRRMSWRILLKKFQHRKQPTQKFKRSKSVGKVATSRHWRGKLFVSIEGNRFRLQTSIPLREYIPQYGYYFNADVTVDFDNAQSLDHFPLSAIVVNGKPVPADLLDWQYDSRPMRSYAARYQNEYNGVTVEVRDGKVVLKSQSR
jgi:hypothetical protein